MAITYLIDLSCPVKAHVRTSKMLRLLYQRDRAHEALNKARKRNPQVAAAEVKVLVSLKDSTGKPSLAATNAADVISRFSELDVQSHHCRQCQARVIPQAFGCRGEIEFPISLRAEAWLMGLVHGQASDPTPKMLLSYLASNGIVGHRPKEMRHVPGIFFESNKSLTRRYASGEKLSIDQVLELLFLTEKISPRHARFLLGMFDLYEGNLPLDGDLNSFSGVRVFEKTADGRAVSRAGVRTESDALDDRSLREIKQFFYAMLMACELDAELKVSL